MNHLLIYLLIVNASGFLLMLWDKLKSIKNRRRIGENTLLGIGLIGGSLGCCLGMYLFRHKTQKIRFRSGLPAMIALHLLIFWFLYTRI